MGKDQFKGYLSTIRTMGGKYFCIDENFLSGKESPSIYNSDADLICASERYSEICNFARFVGVINLSKHDNSFYEYPYPMEVPVGFIFPDGTVFGEK
jgi:hypothetical protein